MLKEIRNKKELSEIFTTYEKKVYSGELSSFQLDPYIDNYTYGDIRDYCEAKPILYSFDGGYLLLTKNEIVDLASAKPVSCVTLVKIKEVIKKTFKDREFEARCRPDTSGRLIRRLIKTKELSVVYEQTDYEGFVNYVLKFNQ